MRQLHYSVMCSFPESGGYVETLEGGLKGVLVTFLLMTSTAVSHLKFSIKDFLWWMRDCAYVINHQGAKQPNEMITAPESTH